MGYDVIVVGAEAARATLAARLFEGGPHPVLMLEAGTSPKPGISHDFHTHYAVIS